MRAHQHLDLIRAQPMRSAYLFKADVVAQRHLNDFADGTGVKPGLRSTAFGMGWADEWHGWTVPAKGNP